FAQDIVSSLSSAMLVLDAEETILFANAPFLEAVHGERRSVIGRKLTEFINPAVESEPTRGGRAALTQAIRTAITSGQPSRLRRISSLLKSTPDRMSDLTVTAI